MNLGLFFFGVLVLAVVLTGLDRAISGPRRAADKDQDGEPDGPPED
ncbi:hypothetical protein [Brevundimonas guildfordensis]|jgi:hypothetical protein|uniref:Uncharacterized protein n=1 Tax=Brevundimonas guildfordensis TaxID=2762241 RepID=A0ABR8QWC5_9CAUL|nr:hypothetical protein [Brevundimonas guildfordensis]MBD7939835.1 hypothetical protein [Brevundimonas guildfordensis]